MKKVLVEKEQFSNMLKYDERCVRVECTFNADWFFIFKKISYITKFYMSYVMCYMSKVVNPP